MNDLSNITSNGPRTMSSREIAELVEKRHRDVTRDIRVMLEALQLDARSFAHTYLDSQNREQEEFLLPRDLTMTLVTGYSIPLRKKVIDRLDELEARKIDPAAALNDPKQLRYLLLENVEKVLALEAEVADLTPKAASYDFLTRTDGTMCITDAAKALGMRPKDLFGFMQSNGWIYRRAGNAHWVGRQHKVNAGYLDHRVEEVTRSDGSTKITEQVRVTGKGMAKLGEMITPKEPEVSRALREHLGQRAA